MTENLSKFLEAVSDDEELKEKLAEAKDKETVIALAAEKGFTLTEDDLKADKPSGSRILSDDELEAVAGGVAGRCTCENGGIGAPRKIASDDISLCFSNGDGRPWEGKNKPGEMGV